MPRDAKVTASLNAKDKTSGAFASVRQRFNKMKAYLDRGFNIGKKLAAGALIGVAALGLLVKRAMDAGDKIDKMRQRIGVSASFLSKLGYAADRSGSSIDVMEKGVARMTRTVADAQNGSTTAQWAIGQLGVSVYDAAGKMKSTETLFTEMVAALGQMQDGALKTAVAQQVFGKSGTALIPMAQNMQQLMQQGSKLGFVWTNQTAGAAATLKDKLDDLWTITGGLANRFASRLFPAITKIAQKIQDWYLANKQVIDAKVEQWADKVAIGIEKMAGWIQTAVKWWHEFFAGMEKNDTVGKFIAGITAQIKKIWDFWEPLVTDLAKTVMQVVGVAWEGIITGVNAALDRIQPVIDTVAEYLAPNKSQDAQGRALGLLGQGESNVQNLVKGGMNARDVKRVKDIAYGGDATEQDDSWLRMIENSIRKPNIAAQLSEKINKALEDRDKSMLGAVDHTLRVNRAGQARRLSHSGLNGG